jgi:transcriptional regulator with XRE-family HTH domain
VLQDQIASPAPHRFASTVPFPGYLSVSREPNLHKHLRERVREAMRLTNTRQADLVNRTGIPKSTISQQLQTGRFDIEVLWKIARALSKDVGWFFPAPRARKMTPDRAAQIVQKVEAVIEWGKRGG